MRQGFKCTLFAGCAPWLFLSGCAEAPENGATTDMAEISADTEMASAAADQSEEHQSGTMSAIDSRAEIPVTMPKVAYVYDFGYRLPGEDIATLQQDHADLCEAQGPYTCQILSMTHSGEEGEYASGQLQLAVAAPKARDFGKKLAAAASGAGGEQVSATMQGEELSKQIVDTEARLRARTVLRDRLLDVLETRQGKVSELVEAERGVARVNEEIDQARSWLEEMRGRVAYSRINIAYASHSPAAGGFVEPVRSAVGSLGSLLGMMVAALIVMLAVIVPLGAIGIGAMRLHRRYGAGKSPVSSA
ncbi:DUF4349 domain-containing protein [Allopontixanthobacter confluentis]|nr:DUF4349 domain-containing protein [Allopontixanthobacter confluentis]